jgi:hypothetical protein
VALALGAGQLALCGIALATAEAGVPYAVAAGLAALVLGACAIAALDAPFAAPRRAMASVAQRA